MDAQLISEIVEASPAEHMMLAESSTWQRIKMWVVPAICPGPPTRNEGRCALSADKADCWRFDQPTGLFDDIDDEQRELDTALFRVETQSTFIYNGDIQHMRSV